MRKKFVRSSTWIRACVLAVIGIATASMPVWAGTTTYVYDTQGRVIQVSYPNGSVVTYTYDKAGNRIQLTKTP